MNAVIADNLIKIYPNGKKAVDDISFTLEQGEVFGFLGPNGAGKTTVVKLLNGMLTATEVVCRVFDVDPAISPVQTHQFSGVVTEHAQMYGNMTGRFMKAEAVFHAGKCKVLLDTTSNVLRAELEKDGAVLVEFK